MPAEPHAFASRVTTGGNEKVIAVVVRRAYAAAERRVQAGCWDSRAGVPAAVATGVARYPFHQQVREQIWREKKSAAAL